MNFFAGLESLDSSLRPKKPRQKNKTLSPSSNSLFVESLILQLCRLIENDSKKQQNMYDALCAKVRLTDLAVGLLIIKLREIYVNRSER